MSEAEDLYEVLQVHPSAHPEVIQAAYRRLAMLHHPDHNPSAEATQMMTRLNHAFEVLNDPIRRAEYDRSRQPPDTSPAPRPGAPAAETGGTTGRPRRRSGTSALDYITSGSRKEDVARIQGPPDSISLYEGHSQESWIYEDVGVICFDGAGRVVEWTNFHGGLKIQMVPGPNATRADFFTMDSHKDDVVRLQGTPHRIDIDEDFEFRNENDLVGRFIRVREGWHYPEGVVEFSISTGRVSGWENTGGSLKARRRTFEQPQARSVAPGAKAGVDFFTLGSTMWEVRRVQGEPDQINKSPKVYEEEWRYGSFSEVTFYRGQVRGWSDTGNLLKIGMGPYSRAMSAEVFSLGSPRDVVASAQGTPTTISVFPIIGRETWGYSGSTVEFSFSSGRVIYWENNDGTLKVRGMRPDISYQDAEKARRQALREKENSEKKTAFLGCFGVVVAVVALLVLTTAVCG